MSIPGLWAIVVVFGLVIVAELLAAAVDVIWPR